MKNRPSKKIWKVRTTHTVSIAEFCLQRAIFLLYEIKSSLIQIASLSQRPVSSIVRLVPHRDGNSMGDPW